MWSSTSTAPGTGRWWSTTTPTSRGLRGICARTTIWPPSPGRRSPWLPTLTEVLDECRGLLVNIEIKNSPKDLDFDPDKSVAEGVVELLDGRGGHRPCAGVVVPPPEDRPGAHARAGYWSTGVPRRSAPPPLDAIAAAVAGGHRAVHPFLFGVLADTATTTVIEAARTAGSR